jgi:hypothetical protein
MQLISRIPHDLLDFDAYLVGKTGHHLIIVMLIGSAGSTKITENNVQISPESCYQQPHEDWNSAFKDESDLSHGAGGTGGPFWTSYSYMMSRSVTEAHGDEACLIVLEYSTGSAPAIHLSIGVESTLEISELLVHTAREVLIAHFLSRESAY